jgi:hypothetical protein
MKQYLLKAFVLLLALTMMLSVFVACGKDDDKKPITDTDADTDTEAPDEEGTTEETEPEYPLGVQPENNNNKEVVILMPADNSIEIAKEASSERVKQAMYERNCDAEEYLGVLITINNEHNGSWNVRAAYNDVIRNDVKDLHTIDIITMQTACSFVTLAQEGLLKNLTDVQSFDFDAPWWVPDMVGQYGMNGNLYGMYGDMTLSLYSAMSTIYFNAKLVGDYNLESPYDMVRNNTWTLENMIKNGKVVEESVDGDYNPLVNKMGFLGLHTAQRTWLAALDIDLVNRNEDTGELVVPKGPSDKLITVFDMFYDLFDNENEFCVKGNSTENHQAFMNGTVLYMLTFLNGVREFRGMEDDYGLVPMPKYNDQQEKYLTSSGTSAMWALPSTTSDDENELSAKLTEVLAYLGKRDVVPEYYEISLGYTYARDENVMQMLEIMREGATLRVEHVYDSAFDPSIWNCLQMTDDFRHPPAGKETTYHGANVTTWWNTNYMPWKISMSGLYKKLSK